MKEKTTPVKIIFGILAVLLSLVLILAPIGIVLGVSVVAPSQYSNTFFGALDAKYERLSSIEHDKLVVVGGSSVAFGLDSERIESTLNTKTVNFGLYADLGTRLMLDLSRDQIKKGDIVVLAPELDAQTLSMYFSWENTLKSFDDDMSMLTGLDRSIDEWLFSIEGFWELASAKLAYSVDGTTPNPTDIYNAGNFNEYGDLDPEKFPRDNNIMINQYLIAENYLIDLDPSIVEEEFLSYMNEYIRDCREKGATVYFSWCPVNEYALTEESRSPEVRAAFEQFFRDNLECEVISSLDDYILDPHYFYDTNLHLNDTGVKLRTDKLLTDILKQIDNDRAREEIAKLEGLEYPMPDFKYNAIYEGESDPNAVYFTYEQLANGSYTITGLTELGKQQTTLTPPLGYKAPDQSTAYIISAVNTDIFAGSACERFIIPDTFKKLDLTGSFSGASSLLSLDIYMKDPGSIAPPDSFAGVGASFRIRVLEGYNYPNHYNWTPFDKIIVEELT